jgi:glycosyltransferase involved in cell wall biosynthesis
MKVLHIISSLKVGGAERALCNFLEQRATQGHNHCVAYFHAGPCLDVLKKLNIPTYQINGWFYRYDAGAYRQLSQLIQHLKPDVLHTSLWAANIIGRLLARQHQLPIINELHGNNIDEGRLRNLLDRRTVTMASRLVAVSDTVKLVYTNNILARLPKEQQQAVTDRLCVIQNGIDVARLHQQATEQPLTRHDLDIDEHAFVIGAVGRLEPIKSYAILIKAFAHLQTLPTQRPVTLCIVGDGSQATALRALAAQLGIAVNAMFMGMRDDAYRFYPLFDCFVLSSQSEGLSLALLEAMSFGIPVVTTHAHATHDVITNGIDGLLVPPNNPEQLGQALHRLCQNPGLHRGIAAAARQRVQTRFTINRVVDSFEQIYKQLIRP